MGTKFGLIVGMAAGYVFGSKAGHERYDQIRQTFDSAMGSRTARMLEDGLRNAWDTAQEEFPGAAEEITGRRPYRP